ncbi:hypothetical protein C0J52_19736 [Blattella germanica]|nr:hypothetical protein C0J52_19736 [Blattella germanica]
MILIFMFRFKIQYDAYKRYARMTYWPVSTCFNIRWNYRFYEQTDGSPSSPAIAKSSRNTGSVIWEEARGTIYHGTRERRALDTWLPRSLNHNIWITYILPCKVIVTPWSTSDEHRSRRITTLIPQAWRYYQISRMLRNKNVMMIFKQNETEIQQLQRTARWSWSVPHSMAMWRSLHWCNEHMRSCLLGRVDKLAHANTESCLRTPTKCPEILHFALCKHNNNFNRMAECSMFINES